MLQLDIVADSETPFFTHRTPLEGKEYDFKFEWNERRDLWVVSIYDVSSGEALATSQVVRHGRNLLSQCTSANKPPGIVFAWSVSPLDLSPPKVNELGARFGIFYWTSAEL